MSGLIPEKRVDKNGVLTTKHVRALPTTISPARPLPSVDDIESRARKAFDSIRNKDGSVAKVFVTEVQLELESKKTSTYSMSRAVLTLHPKTLDRLQTFKPSAINTIADNIRAAIKEGNFSRLNNLAVLRGDCGDASESKATWIIGGLNAHRSRSELLDYSDATEDELSGPRAVLHATLTLDDSFVTTDRFVQHPIVFISSHPLAELIRERPHDVDRIVSIVNERQPNIVMEGISGIVELLDSGTHDAVLNGAL